MEVRTDDRKLDVDHHEAPGEILPESEVKRECVPRVGWYGCTVDGEQIVVDALPVPSLRKLRRRQKLPVRNLSLRTQSVTNRRPEGVEQASDAINVCRC